MTDGKRPAARPLVLFPDLVVFFMFDIFTILL